MAKTESVKKIRSNLAYIRKNRDQSLWPASVMEATSEVRDVLTALDQTGFEDKD
jgi:hypothetical protein